MKKQIKGLEKYSGKWVALNSKRDRVVYAASDYSTILDFVSKKKERLPLLKVPRLDSYLVP